MRARTALDSGKSRLVQKRSAGPKIACLLKEPYSVAVRIARSFVEIANFEGTIGLERLGEAPLEHSGNLIPSLLLRRIVEVLSSDAENLHCIPVQMVLVMTVEADSRREVHSIKLKQTLRDAIELPDLSMEI